MAYNKVVISGINTSKLTVLKESEKMQIDVSYAMHPMTYSEEEDALYLPLLNGRVQCIDRSTLALKWISRAYNGTQALSPITYKNGYVYTGIWGSELTDGAYFCLNAKTGKTVWEMRPSELETVTKAEKLPDFAMPTGQSKPDNFYTYTAVITISAKDGYKFIEIAKILGITPAAINKAKNKIKKILIPYKNFLI
jgi:hypothetical protein